MLDQLIISKIASRIGVLEDSIEIRRQELEGRKTACVVVHDWHALATEDLETVVSECINEALKEKA